jgi:hypothetical protein
MDTLPYFTENTYSSIENFIIIQNERAKKANHRRAINFNRGIKLNYSSVAYLSSQFKSDRINNIHQHLKNCRQRRGLSN